MYKGSQWGFQLTFSWTKYHGNEITPGKFLSNQQVNPTTGHRSKQKHNMEKGICFEKSNLVPESWSSCFPTAMCFTWTVQLNFPILTRASLGQKQRQVSSEAEIQINISQDSCKLESKGDSYCSNPTNKGPPPQTPWRPKSSSFLENSAWWTTGRRKLCLWLPFELPLFLQWWGIF